MILKRLEQQFLQRLLRRFLEFSQDMFLWHPFANKLKRKSKEEVRQKMMMIEGILSVLEGEAPRVIEQKLASYLSMEERRKLAAKTTEIRRRASLSRRRKRRKGFRTY